MWNDRVRGRVPFDATAAETAIRQAYNASGLGEPLQILWAEGPNDAAKVIVFLKNPPRRLRRRMLILCALGAAGWAVLAYGAIAGGFAAPPPWTAAISALMLAGLSLAVAAGHRLPELPGKNIKAISRTFLFLSAVAFFAIGGFGFALQRYGALAVEPITQSIVLLLAGSVGMLPGLLLNLRIRRAYADLPPNLLNLRPSASVADRLREAQANAWDLQQRPPARLRPLGSLLHIYRTAHAEGIARQQMRQLGVDGLAWIREAVTGENVDRNVLGVPQDIDPQPLLPVPPYWDGMEEAERAAALDCAGTTGLAAVFTDLAFAVDRLYPFQNVAVAVRQPRTIALDGEGRPHAEGGPALAWTDGTSICAWHGRQVPADTVDRSRLVTPSRINREMDPERRWVLIERYGLGRYLLESGASEIHRDDCGRLYRLTRLQSEPVAAVRVMNHTQEPDGASREFWLCVPPTMTTARQAVAWTFGLSPDEYDPLAQS
jgi:hypothetical protein